MLDWVRTRRATHQFEVNRRIHDIDSGVKVFEACKMYVHVRIYLILAQVQLIHVI